MNKSEKEQKSCHDTFWFHRSFSFLILYSINLLLPSALPALMHEQGG